MNLYPLDAVEEDQPIQETDYPSPRPPEPPRSRRRQAPEPPQRRSGGGLSKLALAVSVLALALAGIALFRTLEPKEAEEPPAPPEPVTFQFGDRTMTPLEGMPLNPYDREAFFLDDRGRVAYEKGGKAGVDVSTYQKEVDWPAVAADGIDFAILRLGYRGYTEGGLFLDQTFEQNLRGGAGRRAGGGGLLLLPSRHARGGPGGGPLYPGRRGGI